MLNRVNLNHYYSWYYFWEEKTVILSLRARKNMEVPKEPELPVTNALNFAPPL